MGRMAIFLVVGMGMLYGIGNMNVATNDVTATKNASTAYSKTIAQNLANSGFELAMARVTQDYYWSSGWTERPMADAKNRVTVTRTDSTHLLITSTAAYDGLTHTVKGNVERSGLVPYLEAAMLIASDSLALDFTISVDFEGNSFAVNGKDTKPDGTPGSNPSVWGIAVDSATRVGYVKGQLKDNQKDNVTGRGSDPSVSTYSHNWNINNIIAQWIPKATVTLTESKYDGTQSWGTLTDPAVVVREGDLELAGNVRGVGVLIVRGNLKLRGDFNWQGLVFTSGAVVDLNGNPKVYGGMFSTDIENDGGDTKTSINDPGLPGGHFDVDIFNSPNSPNQIMHTHAWDDKYGPLLDMMNNPLLGFRNAIGTKQNLKFVFRHADRLSGNYQIFGDGINLNETQTTDFTQFGTPDYTVITGVRNITKFTITPDNLGIMRGTTPGVVQRDAVRRDESFTCFVYDQYDAFLWEMPLYHHIKENETSWGTGPGSDKSGGEKQKKDKEDKAAKGKATLNVKIAGNSQVNYSADIVNGILNKLKLVKYALIGYYE